MALHVWDAYLHTHTRTHACPLSLSFFPHARFFQTLLPRSPHPAAAIYIHFCAASQRPPRERQRGRRKENMSHERHCFSRRPRALFCLSLSLPNFLGFLAGRSQLEKKGFPLLPLSVAAAVETSMFSPGFSLLAAALPAAHALCHAYAHSSSTSLLLLERF